MMTKWLSVLLVAGGICVADAGVALAPPSGELLRRAADQLGLFQDEWQSWMVSEAQGQGSAAERFLQQVRVEESFAALMRSSQGAGDFFKPGSLILFFESGLTSSQAVVREVTLRLLRQLNAVSLANLFSLYVEDPSPFVRVQAYLGLGQADRALSVLREQASADDYDVRKKALQQLAALGDRAWIGSYYDTTSFLDTLRYALYALGAEDVTAPEEADDWTLRVEYALMQKQWQQAKAIMSGLWERFNDSDRERALFYYMDIPEAQRGSFVNDQFASRQFARYLLPVLPEIPLEMALEWAATVMSQLEKVEDMELWVMAVGKLGSASGLALLEQFEARTVRSLHSSQNRGQLRLALLKAFALLGADSAIESLIQSDQASLGAMTLAWIDQYRATGVYVQGLEVSVRTLGAAA